MSLNNIKKKVSGKFTLLQKQNWTKKKVIILVAIGLLIIFSFVFFNGNKSGSEYIKVNEQDYVEKIVAVGQLGMENQTPIVSQVSGKVDFIGGEEGETVSGGSILISILNSDQEFSTEQKKSAYLDVQEQYNSFLEYDYIVAKEELYRVTLLKDQAQNAYRDALVLYEEGAISQNNLIDYQNAFESAQNQWSSANLKYQVMGPGGSKRDSLFYKMENAKSIYLSSLEDESKYKIKTQWDSVILGAYVNVNDTIKPGDLLLDIGQAETYAVSADLDEKYFLYITKGMKVNINIEGQEKANGLKGEVSVITPKINKNTGTFPIKIRLLSQINYKASDLTVNLEIILKEEKKAIVIPEQYLIAEDETVLVYKGGRALKTKVEIERGPSSNIIIKNGLREGNIILLPTEGLKDGDRVELKKGVEPA